MKTDLTTDLDDARIRSGATRGFAEELPLGDRIDTRGGIFGAGVIRRASVLTVGVEALGHEIFVDDDFGAEVLEAINAAGSQGLKARFTHPGLSADGLGTYLGRWTGPAERVGDLIVADLNLAESSRDTPDGDLGGYLMKLALEDPQAFGASIVFMRDRGRMERYQIEHQDRDGRFRSPDQRNRKNYPHVRLAELRAIDAVDSPAANPDGLFHRDPIAAEAEQLLEHLVGLTDEPPELAAFSEFVHPKRVVGFVSRFLDRHRLKIGPAEGGSMSTATKPAATTTAADQPADTPQQLTAADVQQAVAEATAKDRAELARYTAQFGAEQGTKWFTEGREFSACLADQVKQLQATNAEKDAKLAAIAAQGEPDALTPDTTGNPGADSKPRSLASLVRLRGARSESN